MYKRKTPLDLSCGIRITMEIIGSKWKPCLIDALRETPKRPSQLHREIPETISRVLDILDEWGENHRYIFEK